MNASPERPEPGLFVFVDKVLRSALPSSGLGSGLGSTLTQCLSRSRALTAKRLPKVFTSRLFLRGTTRVPPAALLLFGASPSGQAITHLHPIPISLIPTGTATLIRTLTLTLP